MTTALLQVQFFQENIFSHFNYNLNQGIGSLCQGMNLIVISVKLNLMTYNN